MNEIIKQRDTFHTQLTSFQHVYEQIQQENKSLKEEVNLSFDCRSFSLSLVEDQFQE